MVGIALMPEETNKVLQRSFAHQEKSWLFLLLMRKKETSMKYGQNLCQK